MRKLSKKLILPKIVRQLRTNEAKQSTILQRPARGRRNSSVRKKVLNNVMEVLASSNATLIRCLGSIGFTCCYCDDQYAEAADLKKHTLESHEIQETISFINTRNMAQFYVKVDITELNCNICSNDIDTLVEMIEHLHDVHDKDLFMDVKNFMVPFKFDSNVMRCFMCSNKFNRFKGLLEHMNVHYRNFLCDVCDAGFITRTGLTNHYKAHVTGAFACRFCDKVYNTIPRKKYHERKVHGSAVLNKCGYCSASFTDYHQKLKHLLKVHDVAPVELKCQACDQTFTTQKSYNNHTKRYHLMERRHKCTLCDMKFYAAHELNHHMLKHTGIRRFQCDICLKMYARKNTLREHLRIHVDDRRFRCKHCGMAFVQKCSWRGHMRAIHGEQV